MKIKEDLKSHTLDYMAPGLEEIGIKARNIDVQSCNKMSSNELSA